MQPLKPSEVKSILENQPNAQPGDVEEYERLLSQRFTVDPDFAPAAAPAAAPENFTDLISGPAPENPNEEREARIGELHRKLYGTAASRGQDEQYVVGRS